VESGGFERRHGSLIVSLFECSSAEVRFSVDGKETKRVAGFIWFWDFFYFFFFFFFFFWVFVQFFRVEIKK
jgi:hypothetical protein